MSRADETLDLTRELMPILSAGLPDRHFLLLVWEHDVLPTYMGSSDEDFARVVRMLRAAISALKHAPDETRAGHA